MKLLVTFLVFNCLFAQTNDTVKVVLPRVMHCPVLGLRLKTKLKSNTIQLLDYNEKNGYFNYTSSDQNWLNEKWLRAVLVKEIGIPNTEIESIIITSSSLK